MQQMAERGLLEETGSGGMTLSADGQDQYQAGLENAHNRGDISAEEMAEALSKAASMPQPGGVQRRTPADADVCRGTGRDARRADGFSASGPFRIELC